MLSSGVPSVRFLTRYDGAFCKGYDWQGKRVALFATSGGSGIGRTVEKLRPYVAGGEIVKAEVIRGGKTLDDILL